MPTVFVVRPVRMSPILTPPHTHTLILTLPTGLPAPHLRLASNGSDQSQGIQQLTASREVATRYMWTQLHSTPAHTHGKDGSEAGAGTGSGGTWGTIHVSMQAVVASYRKTIRTLRERRESMLLAQALHELALVFVSKGGADGEGEALKLWSDAVDAAIGLLSSLEVGACVLGCVQGGQGGQGSASPCTTDGCSCALG